MRLWLGREWEEGVEEGRPGTHVPDVTKIKTPTAMSPDEGIEQRPVITPTSPELHVISFPSEPGM